MNIPIYQADAFTDTLFGGNPAAICPLTEWLPDETMQKIAVENNLAETAFFVKHDTGYKLRWFTPEYEIDLCGHATLAAAHILFTELGYTGDTIYFETVKAGTLIVKKEDDIYSMDFPARPPVAAELPVGLVEALGGKHRRQGREALRHRLDQRVVGGLRGARRAAQLGLKEQIRDPPHVGERQRARVREIDLPRLAPVQQQRPRAARC